MRRAERGRRGERAAEKMLRRAGMIVLARNWRGGGGELDLVALDGDTVVFVEVKTRRIAAARRQPAVTRSQRRRIGRAARAFLGRYGARERPFRFDLITIEGDPLQPDHVRWRQKLSDPWPLHHNAQSDDDQPREYPPP